MKKLLLALLVTPATLFINAQTTENPFIKRGYDVLVATSSKGEYAEFHDQADIVEIGSILFNTGTNEVVALLGEGETTIDISSATTAMTIDPHCEKYYWISPYAYVANNPLKFIDPNGKDIWRIGVDGRPIGDVISNNDYDRIEVLNQKGEIIGQTNNFEFGTINQQTVKYSNGKDAYNIFTVKGGDNAKNVFETLANPDKTTGVEWSHSTFTTKDGGSKDYVSTSFQGDTEGSASYLTDREYNSGNALSRHAHNHPVNSPYPSGLWEATGGYGEVPGDMGFAIKRTAQMETKYGVTPKFYMYDHKKGGYVPYSPTSTIYDPQFGIKAPGK